jgi:hypothetical protein
VGVSRGLAETHANVRADRVIADKRVKFKDLHVAARLIRASMQSRAGEFNSLRGTRESRFGLLPKVPVLKSTPTEAATSGASGKALRGIDSILISLGVAPLEPGQFAEIE